MTRFFVRHPVTTWMIFTMFIVLGVYALPKLQIEAILARAHSDVEFMPHGIEVMIRDHFIFINFQVDLSVETKGDL